MHTLNRSLACLAFAFALIAPFSASQAKPVTADKPELIGLYFYASWCSNCKMLEPKLEKAQDALKKEAFLLTTLDVSNKVTQYRSGLLANALGLGSLYEATGVKTGFVILVDPSTGEQVGRISSDATPDQIATEIRAHL